MKLTSHTCKCMLLKYHAKKRYAMKRLTYIKQNKKYDRTRTTWGVVVYYTSIPPHYSPLCTSVFIGSGWSVVDVSEDTGFTENINRYLNNIVNFIIELNSKTVFKKLPRTAWLLLFIATSVSKTFFMCPLVVCFGGCCNCGWYFSWETEGLMVKSKSNYFFSFLQTAVLLLDCWPFRQVVGPGPASSEQLRASFVLSSWKRS